MAQKEAQHDDLVHIGRPRCRWSWTLHGCFLLTSVLLGGFTAVLLSIPHDVDRGFLDARALSAPHRRFTFYIRPPEQRGGARHLEQGMDKLKESLAPRDPHSSERIAAQTAKNAGVLGILKSSQGRGPASVFGDDQALGQDSENVLGGLVGNQLGEAYGVGGLGLVGIGSGGGGTGESTAGLGNQGTIGRGGGGTHGARYRRVTHGGAAVGNAGKRRGAFGRAPRQLGTPVLEAPATLPSIDPNGRFATTYRPGHGRLSWLDAALARGNVPAVPAVLVGDLAGGAAPQLPAPNDRALATQVALERGALPPSGGPVHMRITLRSTEREARRAPLGVHLALDVSGSMDGRALHDAVAAAQELVKTLDDSDRFSLTTFSDGAWLVVPAGKVGPRRAEIRRSLDRISSSGGTNIEAGLASAFAQARRDARHPERISLVLLLSDGQPTSGESRPEALALMTLAAFQDGVQTSAFGLGDSYDDRLMSGLADAGAGGYYYLRSTDAIADALHAELERRLQPVAQAVELRVRLARDVRLVRTYGAHRLDQIEAAVVRTQEVAADVQVARRDSIARDRQQDSEGGMRFFIPAFARNDQHVVLFGLELPPGTAARAVATVELRYKDRVHGRNVTGEQIYRLGHADSDASSFATLNRSVQETVQVFAAGQALVDAAAALRDGKGPLAAMLLAERVHLLRSAARGAQATSLERQAVRLERFRELIANRSGALAEPLTLTLLLGNTGRELLR
jgi:Mg-chelatase subunit ChlD